ncbi:MAG: thioredoxin [Nanoarchaeota archaeon]|nr:thioredoxin [Nanoarchaeota archaeon]
MLELNKDNFQENTKNTTVVDFWAPWCMPCKMLAPTFEAVSSEIEADFAKVNTQDHPELAQENNITGIPCIVVFKDNKEVGRIVGLLQKEQLKEKINDLL